MMRIVARMVAVGAVVSACVPTAQAEVVIETVTVGNPGNAGEWSGESYGGYGPDRVCGAVDYIYNIGKLEVTAGQYTEFLNAVAATDTYGLYSTRMWDDFGPGYDCGIQRSGSPGSYTYNVAPHLADRPVNHISWGDAARFANWLHNGQPSGPQGMFTTEDGSYYLNGAITNEQIMLVDREPDATWVIPSEDQWYKAAYHYNDGVTGNYYDYPTQSDTAPTAEPPPGTDMTNGSANYSGAGDPTYQRTVVGAYDAKPSDSAYGTFDQGGNVWEWNEAVVLSSKRGVRGGAFLRDDVGLQAQYRGSSSPWIDPSLIAGYFGFRVAGVHNPECIQPPPDMVAWWPLDELVGPTAHDIAGGNDATHMNGPTPLPAGKVGGALSFDGIDDYVEVWDNGALDFGVGEGTIDAWIKTEADDGSIFVKGSWLWYYFTMGNGHLTFGICDEWQCWMPAETAGTVNDGDWHHVAATLSRPGAGGVTLDIYIDGIRDATIQHAGPVGYLGSPDQELWIGGGFSALFDGLMDEVEIFNRALDVGEIQAIYLAGSAGKCKWADCNENGIDDAIDIADLTSSDCNGNSIPDECEIDKNSPSPGGPFFCDPAAPPEGLDACDADCNGTGIPDECELTDNDCNSDGRPDECGVVDDCLFDFMTFPAALNTNAASDTGFDYLPQLTTDGQGNWLAVWSSSDDLGGTIGTDYDILFSQFRSVGEDCNCNGIADACDIADCTGDPACDDCNGNDVPDWCDIDSGFSNDGNTNGIPDECEFGSPLKAPYPHDRKKNRYISFDPNPVNADIVVAFKVELLSINMGSCDDGTGAEVDFCRVDRGADDCKACFGSGDACIAAVIDCPAGGACDPTGATCVNDLPNVGGSNVGLVWWVGPEKDTASDPSVNIHLLVSEPFRKVSGNWPNPVHAGDCEVVPQAAYGVRAVETASGTESDELVVETTQFPLVSPPAPFWWGDAVGALVFHCNADIREQTCDPNTSDGDCTGSGTPAACCTGVGTGLCDCPGGDPCERAWELPNGVTNVDDVTAALWTSAPAPPTTVSADFTWVDVHGNDSFTSGSQNFDPPNNKINASDLQQIISGFGGFPYKFYDPADCPDQQDWPTAVR